MYGEVHEPVIIARPVKSATGPPLVATKADAMRVTIEVRDIVVPRPPVRVVGAGVDEAGAWYDKLVLSGEQPMKSGMLTL